MMECGAPYVTTSGELKKRQWLADSWDTLTQVNVLIYIQTAGVKYQVTLVGGKMPCMVSILIKLFCS